MAFPFNLDANAAQRLVNDLSADFRVAAVRRIGANPLHRTTVFEVMGGDGRNVVVKTCSDHVNRKLHKERLVQDVIRGFIDIGTPAILRFDDSRLRLPVDYVVMTRLSGSPLSKLLPGLGTRAVRSLAAQLGAMLKALHEIRLASFGYIGPRGIVSPQPTNLAYMRCQFETNLEDFGRNAGDPGLRRDLEARIASSIDLVRARDHAVLCHNDCHEGNVMVVPGRAGWRISGMLDFGSSVAAHPLFDLAACYCYSGRAGRQSFRSVLDGYGLALGDAADALALYVMLHHLQLYNLFARLGAWRLAGRMTGELRSGFPYRRARRPRQLASRSCARLSQREN